MLRVLMRLCSDGSVGKWVHATSDGDWRIRWRGADLPFRSFFDKLQTVEPGAIVDNKRLGSVLEWIKDRQTAYGPAWNSSHPQRRRTANNLRPEP